MMPPRHWPEGRQRRLALGLFLLALMLLALLFVAPVLRQHRHYDETLEHLAFQAARLDNTLARREIIEAELAALEALLAESEAILPDLGASVAGARFQSHLAGMAERAPAFTLNSTQAMDPEPLDQFVRLGVRIQAQSTLSGLKHFLYHLETGEPIAWVEDLQVQADRAAGAGDRMLNIAMTVTTLMDAAPELGPGETIAGDEP
jgi:hypothetical protein